MILQLMNASDLVAALDASVDDYCDSSPVEVMDRKLGEVGSDFYASVAQYGVLAPIEVGIDYNGWTMGNGHHRLAVAADIGLDDVPVMFIDLTECSPAWYCSEESDTPIFEGDVIDSHHA